MIGILICCNDDDWDIDATQMSMHVRPAYMGAFTNAMKPESLMPLWCSLWCWILKDKIKESSGSIIQNQSDSTPCCALLAPSMQACNTLVPNIHLNCCRMGQEACMKVKRRRFLYCMCKAAQRLTLVWLGCL